MKYTKLGTTDIDVSRICLGTMTWGEQNTQEDAFAQMNYALDQGVNFWDTAELYSIPKNPKTYTSTETMIGNWFKENGKRDEVVLASKIAGIGFPWIHGGTGINKDNLNQALEGSLQRLNTDYLDLYQLHWPNRGTYHFGGSWSFDPSKQNTQQNEDNFLEVLETLNGFVKAGKIKHIGLSNEHAWGTMRFQQIAKENGFEKFITMQNEYSLLNRRFDTDLAEVCHHEQIKLLAYSSLAFGILTGKYQNNQRPAGSRIFAWENNGEELTRLNPASEAATAEYIKVAEKYHLDVTQMALAFVLSRPFTTSVIIGATTMEQLKTNIDSVNVELSQDCLNDIDAVYKKYPMTF